MKTRAVGVSVLSPIARSKFAMPSKIETSLTPGQLQEFFHRCAQLKGTKLKDISALAEEYGIDISLMSASSFRKGAFAEYLENLQAKREQAEAIAEIAKQGLSLTDAAAVKLAVKINDDLDRDEELSIDDKNSYSLAISRLRTGDQRAKFLEAKLRELEREQTEWDEKRRQVAVQVERANNAAPASADDVRAAAVAEIDRIMGITPKAKK